MSIQVLLRGYEDLTMDFQPSSLKGGAIDGSPRGPYVKRQNIQAYYMSRTQCKNVTPEK